MWHRAVVNTLVLVTMITGYSPPRRGVSRAALLASSITVRKSAERKQRTYRPTSLRGVAAPLINCCEATEAAQTGWSDRHPPDFAGLLLRLRPVKLALRATPARQLLLSCRACPPLRGGDFV